jgi:hypothetical protein
MVWLIPFQASIKHTPLFFQIVMLVAWSVLCIWMSVTMIRDMLQRRRFEAREKILRQSREQSANLLRMEQIERGQREERDRQAWIESHPSR